MLGKAWEMKSPRGKSKTSLEHIIKRATKQSENIIIDLSNSKMEEETALKEIKRCFNQINACKRLKVITKDQKLLEF